MIFFLSSDFQTDLHQVPLSEHYEPFWYQQWQDRKLFHPVRKETTTNEPKNTFSMILPPPNITGDLHLGHALTVAIEDAIFRFQKMKDLNRECVYVPGFDHAGIATQAVIDRYLHARTGMQECIFV